MGNCSFKGDAVKCSDSIRIITDSGGTMELKGPLLVRSVINDFPWHGVFRQGHMSSPLPRQEWLLNGQAYYLLPLRKNRLPVNQSAPVRLSSSTASDLVMNLTAGPALEVLPSPGKGVWRVKLVINTKQLEEILSEQVNTEALIEKMRMAAGSSSATPRRNKGSWGVAWRPTMLF